MKFFNSFWCWVGDQGTSYTTGKQECAKVQLMNKVYFSAALIAFLASAFEIAVGQFLSSLIILGISFLIVGGIWLNRVGFYRFSFSIVSWIVSFFIFYLDGSLGNEAGGYYYFFPILLVSASLSDFKNLKVFVLKTSGPLFFFILSVITNHNLFVHKSLFFSVHPPAYQLFYYNVVNAVLSLLAFQLFLFQIVRASLKDQEDLAFSEMKLRAIFNNNHMAMALADTDGSILECNNKFDAIFPNPSKLKLKDLLADDSQKEEWLSYFEEAKQGRRVKFFYEFFYSVGQNKKKYSFRIYFSPVISEHGISGVSISMRDVTQTLQNKKEIKRKSQTLNGILEHVPVAVFRLDEKCDIVELEGNALERLIGKAVEKRELFKNVDLDSVQGRFLSDFSEHLAEAQHGRASSFEGKGTVNGKEWEFNIHLFPDSVKEGGVIGFAIDVTEQATYRKKLQKINEQFDLVLSLSTDGFWDWDLEKDEMYFSPRWKKMFGYEKETYSIGIEEVKEVIEAQDRGIFIDDLEALRRGDIAEFNKIYKASRKCGETLFIETKALLRKDENGNVIRVVCSNKDISELKSKEEELNKQNIKLKRLNNELDSFVYSTSHDLRAPLSSLLGLINITKYETNIENVQNHLLMAEMSIKKLDGFIKDILDYSRNSRLELEKNNIDFNFLVDEVLNQYVFIGNSSKIDIDIQQDYTFISDQRRLSTVLKNLVSNAIKYSDKYKEENLIKISVVVEKEEAKVMVIDNGQGIGRKHLNNIFQMFYKANEYNSGSGLGLYIVHETVQKLKGKIDVESEQGVGSTFALFVPNLEIE